jgi:hypothetical protein
LDVSERGVSYRGRVKTHSTAADQKTGPVIEISLLGGIRRWIDRPTGLDIADFASTFRRFAAAVDRSQ